MGLRKQANELKTDDLLDLLESSSFDTTKEDELITTDEVYNFISYFDIQPGNYKVKTTLLYSLFKRWAYGTELSKIKFTQKISTYFDNIKLTPSILTIKINISALKINKLILNDSKKKSLEKKYVIRNQMHFENFLKKLNLEQGNTFINIDTLFLLYKEKYTKKLCKYDLLRMFKLFFKHKQNLKLKKYWIGINMEKLSDEIKQLVTEMENGEKGKTQEQQVSST